MKKKKKKKKEILFVALSRLTSVEKNFKKTQTFQIHFHFSLIERLRARTIPWFFGHFWKCSEVVKTTSEHFQKWPKIKGSFLLWAFQLINTYFLNRVREMVNFELGKEIEKDVFCLVTTKKKFWSESPCWIKP